MTVRTILSARGAAPRVEAWVGTLVRCTAFLARASPGPAGGDLSPLAEALAARVAAAVGEDHARRLGSRAQLEARLREALAELEVREPARWLKELSASLAGGFQRDALLATYRVTAGEGALPPGAELAFRRLGGAFGLTPEEVTALEAMAHGTAQGGRQGRDGDALARLLSLRNRGWTEPFEALKAAGVAVRWFDASAEYQGATTRLRLDLDAAERVLHLHLLGERGPGPHLICLYGARFPAVLAAVEAARETLSAETVPALQRELVGLCEGLFVERDVRLVLVEP